MFTAKKGNYLDDITVVNLLEDNYLHFVFRDWKKLFRFLSSLGDQSFSPSCQSSRTQRQARNFLLANPSLLLISLISASSTTSWKPKSGKKQSRKSPSRVSTTALYLN